MPRLLTSLFVLILFALKAQYHPRSLKIDIEQGLASHTVYDIIQDDDGAMLITTSRGLQRYNGVDFKLLSPLILGNLCRMSENTYIGRNFSDSLSIVKSDGTIKPIRNNFPEDKSFSTFYCTENAVFRCDGSKFIQFSKDGKQKENVLYTHPTGGKVGPYVVHGDKVILVVGNGLVEIDVTSNRTKEWDFSELYRTVIVDGEDFCDFIATESGDVYRWHDEKLSLQKRDLFKGLMAKTTITKRLKSGNILIGTYGGLFYFDAKWNMIAHYYSDQIISALQEDLEGNIWVGTLQNGIHLIPSLDEYEFDSDFLPGKNNNFSKVYPIGDRLVIGLYGGKLYELDEKGEISFEYQFPVKSEIQSIYYDQRNDELYVFCQGLFKFDWKRKVLVQSLEQSYGPVKTICAYKGQIFTGTSTSIANVNSGEGKASSWISSMESADYIYAVTFEGLQLFNERLERVSKYKDSRTKLIRRLCKDSGKLYAISENELFVLGNSIESLVRFEEGRINEFYVKGNLLLIESEGKIHSFNLKTKKWNYNLAAINETALSLHVRGDYLLIAGMEKVHAIRFNTHQKKSSSKLFIRDVNGSFTKEQGIYTSRGLQNWLELKCEVLPYYGSKERFLRYRVKGLNQNWTELPADELTLRESRLPFGLYDLEIQQSVNGLNWSESTVLQIEILPYFYQTWWFKTLIVLLILFIIALTVRSQFKKLRKRGEERVQNERLKRKAISSELKALRSQMNPHFIFNSLSVIQTKILENKSESAYHNLNAFSKLLRQSLEYTSKEWISLKDELDFLQNYIKLENERFNNEIEFELDLDFEGDLSKLMFPSFLTQPFVENAFRHGFLHKKGERKLRIHVSGKPEHYILSIEDNGVGIEASRKINSINRKEHKSFAVASINDRIALLNQSKKHHFELHVESSESGTKVELSYRMKS